MIENNEQDVLNYKAKAEQLESELALKKAEENREAQRSRAIVEAAEKGLPPELAREFCVGNSTDETLKKITVLSAAWEQEVNRRVNSVVAQRFQSSAREIEKPDSPKGMTIEDIKKMSTEEILANYDNVLKAIKK